MGCCRDWTRTIFLRGPDEDYTMSTKGRMFERVRVILAGRAAEEVCPALLIRLFVWAAILPCLASDIQVFHTDSTLRATPSVVALIVHVIFKLIDCSCKVQGGGCTCKAGTCCSMPLGTVCKTLQRYAVLLLLTLSRASWPGAANGGAHHILDLRPERCDQAGGENCDQLRNDRPGHHLLRLQAPQPRTQGPLL